MLSLLRARTGPRAIATKRVVPMLEVRPSQPGIYTLLPAVDFDLRSELTGQSLEIRIDPIYGVPIPIGIRNLWSC
jgi:hypothetical protein